MMNDGQCIVIILIWKYCFWEVFLVEKLDFLWDEVYDIVE